MSEPLEWLRPAWLFALPAGLALLWLWWRAQAGAGRWRRLVDPVLLPHLVGRGPAGTRGPRFASAHGALAIAATALFLVCVALAGPSWRSHPAPLIRDLSARIVVLDLSPSMDAIDVVPSRLERARAAIVSILRESPDAQLGLVVFGADAFTVAPLMNDASALIHLLESLSTATVPRSGSRPDLGLEMARTLLARAGVAAGEVILVGDSAGDARTLEAARALAKAGFPLSVLAVGTLHGGPVRLAGGAFARTDADEILVAKPELAGLERVARAGGGQFHALAAGGTAPRFARGARTWAETPDASDSATRLRRDDGAWFVLLALPFAALLFRRGWLVCLAALALSLPLAPRQALAFDWQDLWRRADQQAAAEFSAGTFGGQARLVSMLDPDSPWRAMLLYRSGRFAEAAVLFAARDTADAHYNRGNALALDGRLEEALAAYAAALERSPSMRDALFNRALVREALAKRRARAQADGQATQDPAAASPSNPRPGSGSVGRGQGSSLAANAARRGARSGEDAGSSQAQVRGDVSQAPESPDADGAARRLEDRLDAPELQRLEGLLAKVPDDPGSLLANRFAWQLRLRGNWNYDTGTRW